MKIGELADRASCPVETIRYYERQGLIPEPDRTDGNYRDYGQDHLEQLTFIRNCRGLDMSHEEIKSLLRFRDSPTGDCAGVNLTLDAHIAHVRQRIAELHGLYRQLIDLRCKCATPSDVEQCGILRNLAENTPLAFHEGGAQHIKTHGH